jgi:hypothetical protein
MLDMEKTIIPLDDAHEILGTFGIGPYNTVYQRWRRDDGFRWCDLEGVLNESPLVLAIDWREWLQDAVETIVTQLDALGINVASDLDEEGNQGHIEIDGGREAIKFVPADDDDFDNVVQSVNRLIKDKAQYRKFRSCEGSDGWWYGLLTNEQWVSLESAVPNTCSLMFFPA